MPAGRPRKPSALKKAKGTFRKDRGDFDEMKPDPWAEDTPPHDLNEHGKKEWQSILPQLKSLGVLTKVDTSMVWMYCNEWGKYMEYEDKLKQQGRVFKTKSGYPMINPYEVLADKAFKKAKELAVQFGLTPASRTRISTKAQDGKTVEENNLDQLTKLRGKVIPIRKAV